MSTPRRPRKRGARTKIKSSIDQEAFMMLEMLGFHIPSLVEELLNNVAAHKKCPTCGREVRPVITGRKVKDE